MAVELVEGKQDLGCKKTSTGLGVRYLSSLILSCDESS